MTEITLTVPNISCEHCVRAIQGELSELDGVKSVNADEATRTVRVGYDAPASEAGIVAALRDIDYPPDAS